MVNRRYYGFNTMFRSLKDDLRVFLKRAGIYYELSGRGAGWHFEILANDDEVVSINNWLDANTIVEQRA